MPQSDTASNTTNTTSQKKGGGVLALSLLAGLAGLNSLRRRR
jgi:hypothetical protein